jgi:hypothetical protein
MALYNVREEVVNVVLAELLEKRGLLSIPETIRRSVTQKNDRQLPDIIVADLLGIRIVIEGRFDNGKSSRDSLLRDSRERVEQGISPVCLAALYPPDLRSTESIPRLRKKLESTTLEIRVISENGDGDWSRGTVDDIADALRHSYELLISDDVVLSSVEEIEKAIEFSSELFVHSKGLKGRFRQVLGIPASTEKEEATDED